MKPNDTIVVVAAVSILWCTFFFTSGWIIHNFLTDWKAYTTLYARWAKGERTKGNTPSPEAFNAAFAFGYIVLFTFCCITTAAALPRIISLLP